jgi:hypothetical protein
MEKIFTRSSVNAFETIAYYRVPEVVEHFGDDIVAKWAEFFVLHRRIEPQVICRRLP